MRSIRTPRNAICLIAGSINDWPSGSNNPQYAMYRIFISILPRKIDRIDMIFAGLNKMSLVKSCKNHVNPVYFLF